MSPWRAAWPRLSARLFAYVAREVGLHAAVGLAAVSVVFVGRNLMRYGGELLAAGASVELLALVLGCVLVASLTYTLPIAFLFGVLAGVARLAGDRETLAFQSCGLGLRVLVLPVLVLGLGVSAACAWLALELEPRAKQELRGSMALLAASAPQLEPGRFTVFGDRTLWVGARQGTRLERVFAADLSRSGRPVWIFAERGEVRPEGAGGGPRLELRDGDLLLGSDGPRVRFQRFELPLADAGAGRWRLRPKDLHTAELRRVVASWQAEPQGTRPAAHEVQLARRQALPAAPLLFGLAAMPLALRRRRGARAWAVLCCSALVLGYYALMACGQQLALQGVIGADLGLWSPNLALAGLGLLALRAGAPS